MSTSNPKSAKDTLGGGKPTGARRRTAKKQSRSSPSRPKAAVRATKKATITKLLHRKQGATLATLQAATGWKPHSLRAALTGLRKTGVEIRRSTNAKGETIYRAVGL